MEKKRLSKVLAASGVASRRAAETLIFSGKVRVNGEVVRIPQTMVSPDSDSITVNGSPIKSEEKKVYFALNKPQGYVCSNMRRSKRTKLVVDLFDGIEERLFTVGRLDKDTQGLIFVTNDGSFAQKVIHPSSNLSKEYVAKTNCELTDKHLKLIGAGTEIEGTWIKPLKVTKVRKATVKIVVGEGKKHEVRHLLENAGLEVLSLKRTRIGGFSLGKIPEGMWKQLRRSELESIFA
ncbi:MAG: pseudouridine synthase [Chlamydiales bacterium]